MLGRVLNIFGLFNNRGFSTSMTPTQKVNTPVTAQVISVGLQFAGIYLLSSMVDLKEPDIKPHSIEEEPSAHKTPPTRRNS